MICAFYSSWAQSQKENLLMNRTDKQTMSLFAILAILTFLFVLFIRVVLIAPEQRVPASAATKELPHSAIQRKND